jgi:hypothetical protein
MRGFISDVCAQAMDAAISGACADVGAFLSRLSREKADEARSRATLGAVHDDPALIIVSELGRHEVARHHAANHLGKTACSTASDFFPQQPGKGGIAAAGMEGYIINLVTKMSCQKSSDVANMTRSDGISPERMHDVASRSGSLAAEAVREEALRVLDGIGYDPSFLPPGASRPDPAEEAGGKKKKDKKDKKDKWDNKDKSGPDAQPGGGSLLDEGPEPDGPTAGAIFAKDSRAPKTEASDAARSGACCADAAKLVGAMVEDDARERLLEGSDTTRVSLDEVSVKRQPESRGGEKEEGEAKNGAGARKGGTQNTASGQKKRPKVEVAVLHAGKCSSEKMGWGEIIMRGESLRSLPVTLAATLICNGVPISPSARVFLVDGASNLRTMIEAMFGPGARVLLDWRRLGKRANEDRAWRWRAAGRGRRRWGGSCPSCGAARSRRRA